MTKDRRLGKGLAALLGTPLEEDQIVEGSASDADRSPAGKSAEGISNPNAAGAVSTQRVQPRQAATDVRKVTGAIPLNRSNEALLSGPLELSVHEIDKNPFQPRREFNDEEINSLAESIREHQQLQPILVRRVDDRYQLISGERRLRATIHAGLKTIRAEVREADDRLVAELAIVENLQRKDLNAVEKALSFRRYIDEHKCTQEDLAKRLKIDRSTIANLMRLLELPDEIQQSIQEGLLTAGHARALLPLGEEEQQLDFARQIKLDAWNVRDTERAVTEHLALEDGAAAGATGGGTTGGGITGGGSTRPRMSPQVALLEQQLRLAFGTKTEIRQNARGRGKITIHFTGADEFDRICQLICPELERKAA